MEFMEYKMTLLSWLIPYVAMDWNVGQTVREVFRLNERMDRVLHGHCVDPGLVVLDNEHHHPLTHLCVGPREYH